MALGSTNISISLVKSTLSESVDNLYDLGKSDKINKWSKYKPVIGTWPIGSSGVYGIDVIDNWTYKQPGFAGEPIRLGDFRQYKHDALPVFELVSYPSTTQENVDTFTFGLDVNESDITVEDFLIDEWFFGVKVDSTYYSANYALKDRDTEIEALSIQVTGITNGTHTWECFISQYQASGGGEPDTWVALPTYSGYVISGSTTVTLVDPYVDTINNTTLDGAINCIIDGSYIKFTALNRGADYNIDLYNHHTSAFLGTDIIHAGDPVTGLPETTEIIPNISAPTGYGNHETIRVEDASS